MEIEDSNKKGMSDVATIKTPLPSKNAFPEQTEVELYEEIKEILSEIRELKNTEHSLDTENKELHEKKKTLQSELDGIDIVIPSLKEDISSTEKRIHECHKNIENLKMKQEQEIEEINEIQRSIRTVTEDNKKCSTLRSHLTVEFESIMSERSILLKQLKDIEEGVQTLSSKKMSKMPHLRGYDTLLKRVYMVFRETENRMNVALKLMK